MCIRDSTSSSSSNTGNSITPLAITTATLGVDCSLQGEELEGMLVRVSDVTVEDIDEFIKSQMLMVAPIQLGAGLKMKIPHSLANGTPVITTRIGAEGIDISSENGLWVCNEIELMVNKINSLLQAQNLLIEKGKAGQDAVKKLFSEEVVLLKFEKLYSQLVKQ